MKKLAGFVVAAVACAAGTAGAAEEIGESRAVVDHATASGQVGERVLAVGSVVHLGDLVTTDAQGEAQLLFRDGTRMVVGPTASLVLDEFVFRSGAQENSFAVRALGGAFRFIGGEKRQADGYMIHTPTATIGVRGTTFDFTVRPEDTSLILLEGMASLCGGDGSCAIVRDTCGMARADRGQGAGTVDDPKERVRQARALFPYLKSQDSLAPGFHVPDKGCTSGAAATAVPSDQSVASAPAAPAAAPPDAAPPAPEPAPPPEPSTNRSGLGDGTNPGRGSQNAQAGSGGSDNPGGGGGGPGGGAGGADSGDATDSGTGGNGRGGGNGGGGNGRGGGRNG